LTCPFESSALLAGPVTAGFVAEIGDVDLSKPLGAADEAAIKEAFWQYAVLIFPQQELTPQQHIDFAQRFVFASVASYAARKRLPNGENAHCTVRPAQWWRELFRSSAERHPDIAWEVWVQSWIQTAHGGELAEEHLGSNDS